MSAPLGRPKGCQSKPGAAQRRTGITPFPGKGAGGDGSMNALGRPKVRQSKPGAAQRRTGIAPFLGKGVGGMVP